ncbi:MAG: transcription-repair coupling factor [Alphaproteobacteria bacterium]
MQDDMAALALAELSARGDGTILHVARDDRRLAALAAALPVFDPGLEIVEFPAWDCLPYDRVSPNPEVASRRLDALLRMLDPKDAKTAPRRVVLTTVNAILQRVPPGPALTGARFAIRTGMVLDLDELNGFLVRNGYARVSTVREPGECALRGGIIDIFPAGSTDPVRLDLFGDEVEKIRGFDPATQISAETLDQTTLKPVSEVRLDPDSIAHFRAGYRDLFGAISDDPLYEAVSEGQRMAGMEHWLPLFYGGMETLLDYLPGVLVSFDHQAADAANARFESIEDFYEARQAYATIGKSGDQGVVYRPLPPNRLYMTPDEWNSRLNEATTLWFSPFSVPDGASRDDFVDILSIGGRRCIDFVSARTQSAARKDKTEAEDNIFDEVRNHIVTETRAGRRVVIAAHTEGSRERIARLLVDHGVPEPLKPDDWADILGAETADLQLLVLAIEHGFTCNDITVIGEQDILGERVTRRARRRRADAFLADAAELSTGDFVVHVDHGIGRYEGLETITVSGAPHDCLRLSYDAGDRLFLPVENIEVLSRYGSAESEVALDRLGGAAWQARKSRLKKRLRDMADELIQVAAARLLRPGRRINAGDGMFDEFCARFPYTETDDQRRAIDETMEDLSVGRPMDRLICGDVGFGKTEIALRAAYAAVMEGGQVAVVAPTTLLCRQHFATFSERFRGYPVQIAQLSRLVTGKQATEVRAGLTDGTIDIVIGTHALLSKRIEFKDLSLLVLDEEQHFGVAHKERLKRLRTDVHVLTLTATPIPRTLQLALTGVKDLSMIATPPIDRLAVRTFVLPYDPVIIREAIMRERFRGGQIFYVCPRVRDLPEIETAIRGLVPELRVAIAHGQMGARALEEVMTRFYEGSVDLLLSTQIVESGLDIPTANTLIIHRADMFGLAQLYQLRGRVGRSKQRAYCYLTLPPRGILTAAAEKRLEVMQSLDALGAGFTLASHDLDIRGAGNLLGEEQSGHIREVGVELFQQLLEEAVATARGEGDEETLDGDWSPQINIGTAVLIPESYIADLDVRLGLYRRLASLTDRGEIEAFAAELIDRFGSLPNEVENLLEIVGIKQFCKQAGIAKLDTGPKGAVLSFHNDRFARPEALVAYIQKQPGQVTLRPDHRLVFRRDWTEPDARLKGARRLVIQLAKMAAA